jgi:hypothetical protein
MSSKQGTSAAYLVARLKRDAPEFAHRLAGYAATLARTTKRRARGMPPLGQGFFRLTI